MTRATEFLEKLNEAKGKSGRFVVQEHHATTSHYDFRLELDGGFRSWAVPKGPSMDPSDARLAIPTPKHSDEDAHVEGVIPKDEYGAGYDSIWDEGTFDSFEEDREGMKFNLHGKKLKGMFTIRKTGKNNLLIKMQDDYAEPGWSLKKNKTRTAAMKIAKKEWEKQDNK